MFGCGLAVASRVLAWGGVQAGPGVGLWWSAGGARSWPGARELGDFYGIVVRIVQDFINFASPNRSSLRSFMALGVPSLKSLSQGLRGRWNVNTKNK